MAVGTKLIRRQITDLFPHNNGGSVILGIVRYPNSHVSLRCVLLIITHLILLYCIRVRVAFPVILVIIIVVLLLPILAPLGSVAFIIPLLLYSLSLKELLLVVRLQQINDSQCSRDLPMPPRTVWQVVLRLKTHI